MITTAIGWLGALTMVSASFHLDGSPRGYILAITGLLMLSAQAIKLKVWNLLALNVASIIGFTWNLLS